jgi:uncharacterized membrane protein
LSSGKSRKTKKQKAETTKKVIWVCLINGFAWVWCSYILAYLDKMQIAESLSQVAVTEIIGVVLAYCIKSAVENLSKNNRWPDKYRPSVEHTNSGTG